MPVVRMRTDESMYCAQLPLKWTSKNMCAWRRRRVCCGTPLYGISRTSDQLAKLMNDRESIWAGVGGNARGSANRGRPAIGPPQRCVVNSVIEAHSPVTLL